MVARVADDQKQEDPEERMAQVSRLINDAINQTPSIRDKNISTASTTRAAIVDKQERKTLGQKLRHELEEPAVVIVSHAVLIVFGILVLSFLGWLVDHAHISDLAKEFLHIIDEYLMIFAFVILGFSFIIKIVTVVLGGVRK
jgi:hypothetical protein